MITPELKKVILKALNLDDWDIDEETQAPQVPGWDSLSHVSVIVAVERHFGVHFKPLEVLRLKKIGDLQRLIDLKINK